MQPPAIKFRTSTTTVDGIKCTEVFATYPDGSTRYNNWWGENADNTEAQNLWKFDVIQQAWPS